MNALHGAAEADERLKQTALRDFGPPIDNSQRSGSSYRLELDRNTAPVPRLLMYALSLIGLQAHGPGEKVEWWVDFSYRGQWCELAHQKFGLRLYLQTEAPTAEARKMLAQIAKQLKSSTRAVEKLILASAPDLLGQGDATVVNQHESLRTAYAYFRERAIDPTFIADEYEEYEPTDGLARVSTFTSGQIRMELNAFHDLVAAITAYLSLLEHDLVLALAFSGFDPSAENLTDVIGSRWGEKFRRVLGVGKEASRYLERLNAVVERWRNPYSHGGFEKGHGATIYLHASGVGAVPVGLSAVRTSPLFSLIPATDTDVMQVFELFDEVDSWVDCPPGCDALDPIGVECPLR